MKRRGWHTRINSVSRAHTHEATDRLLFGLLLETKPGTDMGRRIGQLVSILFSHTARLGNRQHTSSFGLLAGLSVKKRGGAYQVG